MVFLFYHRRPSFFIVYFYWSGSEITEDEKPFEIPEGWMWVRLGHLCNIINGFTPSRSNPDFWNGSIPWFTIDDIRRQGRFISHTAQYITNKALSKGTQRLIPPETVLLCCTASVGEYAYTKIALTTNQQFNALVIQEENTHLIWSMYLYVFAQTLKPQIIEGAGKTTFNFLSVGKLKEFLVPVPPFDEQKRIVAKIEELLPLVDRYEQAWAKLEDFNRRFPEDMKKSILQQAIQGKLVEQRPEEGTAQELYAQIQAEKQCLIKEGKVKKEKPLPEITEDEKPFEIPDGWMWVRFGNIGDYRKGPFGSALTKNIFVPKGDGTIKVYEQKNAIHKNVNLGNYYISKEYFEEKMKGFEVVPGDIIVSCAGTIGETYVMPIGMERGIINQALMRMRIFSPIFIPYFLIIFDTILKQNARKSSKGSAIKNIPPFDVLKKYIVPLPPLAEQKRIVARLEELLPLCDKLR